MGNDQRRSKRERPPKSDVGFEVAAAVLWRGGRILTRWRRQDERLPGVWEFPGGKVRDGERAIDAAKREVREEMAVEAADLSPLETIEHDYPDRRVRIHVFEGRCEGDPAPPDGAAFAWLLPRELVELPIPEANRDLVTRLAAGDLHSG